jgi:aspartate kinase
VSFWAAFVRRPYTGWSSAATGRGASAVKEATKRVLERAIISGVAHTVDESVYRVDGISAADLFTALADAGVNVDTILQSADDLVFSASTDDDAATATVLDALAVNWVADSELGQVSVFGAGMRSHPGVAAKAFATLEEQGIEPVIVTTSPIRISCHVRQDAVEPALRALRVAFGLSENGDGTGG